MTVSDYLIDLGLFHGPLDLLVFLVRRGELESTSIPVANVAREFLGQVHSWEQEQQQPDFELAGDVVVATASLVEIKSNDALPGEPENEEEDESAADDDAPASEIIDRLLTYKKIKHAADELEAQAAIWRERYARVSDDRPRAGRDPSSDRIKGVELWDLVAALSRVLEQADPTLAPSAQLMNLPHLKIDPTPISVYSARIREQVDRKKRVSFSSLFSGEKDRSVIVGIFLAILELLRHYAYRAEQETDYGEIWVLPPV